MRRIAFFAAFFLAILTVAARADTHVVVLDIKGAIGVATADYVPREFSFDLITDLNDPESVNFALPTNPLQVWELEYDGTFTPPVTLTFHYDDCGVAHYDHSPVHATVFV